MKLLRLEDLYIRQLEYLFSPPGLPLVAKADPKGAPTTTILIRGEAGAGKTTLALALAHSIARARKGALLVLNTETAPVEVDAKAVSLDIPRKQVIAWPGRAKARKGTILVQHIALAAAPGELDPDSEQPTRPGILDTIWDMLRVYNDEDPARTPIVAVMIDGMLLAERDENTGPTRSDTAAFLQALETRGISTVMIEESALKQSSWLPFVVDLVFELQFNLAEDTHKLVRQLVCRKSRYTPAFAGPHEYDLDEDNVLAVWPDPLDIDPEILRAISGADANDPRVFWPTSTENTCWVWRGAGLLSAQVSREWDIVQALSSEPSSDPLVIDLGELETSRSDSIFQPHNRGGVYAIVWDLLRAASEQGRATIVLHELDRLLARSQSPTLFVRALRALLRSGLLIGVRGKEDELKILQPFVTYSPSLYKIAGEKPMAKREGLCVERWFVQHSSLATITGDERVQLSHALSQHSELHGAKSWLNRAELDSESVDILNSRLQAFRTIARNVRKKDNRGLSPLLSLVALECIQRLDRACGTLLDHISLLGALDEHDSRVSTQRALMWFLAGDDWRSARSLVPSGGIHHALDRVLWTTHCARYAGSGPSTELLNILAANTSLPLEARRLAASSRACIHAIAGEPDQASACIDSVAPGLDPWLVERWHAEVSFNSTDKTVLAHAEQRLRALAIDPGVPSIHKAEIHFNLALRAEHRDDPAGMETACNHALTLNPALEPTIQRLRTRLQTPPA